MLCGKNATIAHMSTVASRDLRNHTADVLRQVAEGTSVTITVHGVPVARIDPVRAPRKQFMSKAEFTELVSHRQADPGLRQDLQELAGETTDELGPPG
jgi:prevent-host-death family protein